MKLLTIFFAIDKENKQYVPLITFKLFQVFLVILMNFAIVVQYNFMNLIAVTFIELHAK